MDPPPPRLRRPGRLTQMKEKEPGVTSRLLASEFWLLAPVLELLHLLELLELLPCYRLFAIREALLAPVSLPVPMLHLLNHPLGSHIITHLRDRTTKPATFRTLTYQIGLLLALESTRDLRLKDAVVETPLETHRGAVLSDSLVLVPILRAAIGLVQPFTDLFPDVSIGYVGFERDHETAIARNYYCKLPPLTGRRVLIVDPMLATGGSAVQTIQLVQEYGGQNVAVVCVVAAPEGVKAVEAVDSSIPIFAAVLDRELNSQRYILPGVGDYGDRLYGT
jgi:uracil phosphoribosyltransferase